MKSLLSLALVAFVVAFCVGAVNAQLVYVFPDGRVQWTPNVHAQAVDIDDLPAAVQDALLAQRANFYTLRERYGSVPHRRPRPMQYINGIPTRSGLIPSRLRQPQFQQPNYPDSSGPSIRFGIGFGVGPFSIQIGN
jgi:hypothetical protein